MRRRRLLEYLALLLGAAFYFAWGCTSGLDLTDEGQIVFGIWRTADGSIPYVDFTHLYGPSLFFLNGALLRWFGEDLLVIRISLVILKAFTAVLVYACSRLVASRPSSLLAYILVVVVWGTPSVFNAPYSNHYAIALLLGGILVFVSTKRRLYLACFLAGLCLGLTATFKQTTGVFAVLWFSLFLLVDTPSAELESSVPQRRGTILLARAIRWMVLLGSLGVVVAYLATGTTVWNLLVISGPFLGMVAFLALREARLALAPREWLASALGIVSTAAGAALPVLAYVALYTSLGQLDRLVFNTGTLGALVTWFVPFPLPQWRTLLCATAVVTLFGAVRLWRSPQRSRRHAAAVLTGFFAVSLYLLGEGLSMPGGMYAFLRGGAWYGDIFRVVYVLPLVTVLMAVPAVLPKWERRSVEDDARRTSARRLLFAAAAGSLLSLHPAADLWHVFMVLPMFLPTLSWELDSFHRVPGSSGSAGRVFSVSVAVVFGAILAAPFIHQTVRGWTERPPSGAGMNRATGIVALTPRFADQTKLASHLAAQRRDEGILILTNEQLLYFLSDQRPVMEEQEFVLYLAGGGLIGREDARKLVPEEAFIQRLREAKPLIVDALQNRMVAGFRDVFPEVARFIDENYRVDETIGTYRVLRAKNP